MAMLPLSAGWLWQNGSPPERGNSVFCHRYAFYNVFETADGKYVSLGAMEPRFWEAVCIYFGVPEFVPFQYDENRKEEIIDFFRSSFMRKKRDDWMKIFSKMDICLSAVLEIDEALESGYAREREMVIKYSEDEKDKGLGAPVKLSDSPAAFLSPPPQFGEHTKTILNELGYSDSEIQKFKTKGAV